MQTSPLTSIGAGSNPQKERKLRVKIRFFPALVHTVLYNFEHGEGPDPKPIEVNENLSIQFNRLWSRPIVREDKPK